MLSITELAVLGLLTEGPRHGFAISKDLAPESDVGRVLTVRRPLIYRALERLAVAALAEPIHIEPGKAGPQRVIYRVTRKGRNHLRRWLAEPVDHVRDLRIEFLLKLVLLRRTGVSPKALIESQRTSLTPTFEALERQTSDDPVELWRLHNARAAGSFLDDLLRT